MSRVEKLPGLVHRALSIWRSKIGQFRQPMDSQPADSPGVVIWPPLLYASAMLVGVGLHFLLPLAVLPKGPSRVAGALVLAGGLALGAWGERTMHRAGTNVHPSKPALVLVHAGPFRLSRNPLYIGLTLMYAGLALLVPAVWPLLLLIPVLGVMSWGVVRREERYLERKFGERYRQYKAHTRRWL
jgi:protein-S-isoprenylcysteine O-methyltransferase Ste14